jgi:L-arabinokinase
MMFRMARRDVFQLLQHDIKEHNFFDTNGLPIHTASAPARLDALGGLGAQAGSTLAQMALPLRTAVALQLHKTPELIVAHPGQPHARYAARFDHPPPAPLLALWQILHRDLPPQAMEGARLIIQSTIPSDANQGDTTALLVAALIAICHARNIAPPPSQLATYVQQAQELASPSTRGTGPRVDATTCLLAADPEQPHNPRQTSILRYTAQPCELIGHIPLPANVRILALDTGVRNSTPAFHLQELHVAGAMGLAIIETIYRDLGQSHTPLHGYLTNTSPLLYRQYFRALLPRRLRGSDFLRTFGPLPADLQTVLDPTDIYRVRTAVDHFIAENEHAEQFLQAIEELSEKNADGQPAMTDPEERQRTLQRAGRLALASHHSYRLRLELSCPEADWLVDHLMEAGPDRGIYGARITGPGAGGTVMALVDQSSAAGDAILETIEGYPRATGKHLAVTEAGAPGSAGALIVHPHPHG